MQHLLVKILSFYLTPGNVDDRNPEIINQLSKELFGKLFGDKGLIRFYL